MSVAFRAAPFKTTGGTTARSLDAWFSDVINVAEFASLHTGAGTFGSGSGNDAPCIQAALDLAFGATPNGWDNRHLNRPVFIPAGRYRITSPLVLTKVVGGHIFGAGRHATQIHYEGTINGVTLTTLLDMNGCADLCIEKLYLEMHNQPDDNTCVINLDWDGDDTGNGCDGNHDNHFQELAIGGGTRTIIIGSDATSEGHNNLFLNCTIAGDSGFTKSNYGMVLVGPNADNNQVIGGGFKYYIDALVWCPTSGGSVHIQSIGCASPGPEVEYIMESDKVMRISQVRSEAENALRMENGIVIMQAITTASGVQTFAEINGGRCILEGNDLHGNAGTEIIGTGGKLYLQANFFHVSANTPLSGYSGDVVWDPDGVE